MNADSAAGSYLLARHKAKSHEINSSGQSSSFAKQRKQDMQLLPNHLLDLSPLHHVINWQVFNIDLGVRTHLWGLVGGVQRHQLLFNP